jgi:hypothetical protein
MATCQAALKHSLSYPDGATTLVGCSPATVGGTSAYECQVTRNGNWKTACYQAGTQTEQVHYLWAGGCEQRNGALGGPGRPARESNTHTVCLAGCEYTIEPGTLTTTTVTSGQSSSALYKGQWHYTGETCSYPVPVGNDYSTPPDPKTECVPAGAGQTYCSQPDGSKCHTASTGRTICWGANETGEKTDGPTLQRNENGPNSTPPVNPPPPPTTLNPGTPTNVNTSGPNGSFTITITNWTTSNGGPAGPNNQGSNTGPNGGPTSNNNGGGGSVTGGGTCAGAPVCSGEADPVGCAIALQTYKTRCSIEHDPTGGTSAFEMVGVAGEPGQIEDADSSGLIDQYNAGKGGWASRGQCPVNIQIATSYKTYTVPKEHLCSLLDAIAALVYLAGTISAGMILLGAYKGI